MANDLQGSKTGVLPDKALKNFGPASGDIFSGHRGFKPLDPNASVESSKQGTLVRSPWSSGKTR